MAQAPNNLKKITYPLHKMLRHLRIYWRGSWWHKLLITVLIIVLLALTGMYGIARWYIWSERNKSVSYGVSFIPEYAKYLGVDPKETMDALISDVHVRQFRLTSYWDTIEPTNGTYDFTQLDWEFQKAEAAHATVSLSVGLRQPRWPECHVPSWVDTSKPVNTWQPELETFMSAVVNRYKNSPALQSYQIENEYFLKGFGICQNFDRSRLVSEYNLVKKLDPRHTLIVNRSNNALGMPIGAPQADEYGISIYKRVWDAKLTHRYVEYPFPAWYYAFLAGTQKILTGKDMIIHEMQAEAWAPDGKQLTEISIAEQNKSLNATRLNDRFSYGKATGMKHIDMWGAEYWYYRKVVLHDPSLWNVAKDNFEKTSN